MENKSPGRFWERECVGICTSATAPGRVILFCSSETFKTHSIQQRPRVPLKAETVHSFLGGYKSGNQNMTTTTSRMLPSPLQKTEFNKESASTAVSP